MKIKKSAGEKVFDILNLVFMGIFAFICLYPFINILAISFNDALDSNLGGIYFLPRKFTIDSYIVVIFNKQIGHSAIISVLRTVIGTLLTVTCCSMFAYTFTKNKYIFYKAQKVIFFVAMFVGAGALIPTYMLYRTLGLLNNFAVYVIPYMVSPWFVILFRTYFMGLPQELEEAAYIDGANDLRIFVSVILPLSLPMLATVGLFSMVMQWNMWRDTLFFANKEPLKTLQFKMQEILLAAQSKAMIVESGSFSKRIADAQTTDPKSVRMAITIVTTIPIVMVYPFLQKYFIKGMLVGSMKG
jgi:putative aldouronate transport system permease protein